MSDSLEKSPSMPVLKIASLEGRNVSPTKASPSRTSSNDVSLVRTRSSDISPHTPRAADPVNTLRSKLRESNKRSSCDVVGLVLSKSESHVK